MMVCYEFRSPRINYSLSTGRLPISLRMATSHLSASRFDDDEETRY